MPDAEGVRQHCRSPWVAYKVPRVVSFREGLPRSTVGKVQRRILVEEAVAGARGDERARIPTSTEGGVP